MRIVGLSLSTQLQTDLRHTKDSTDEENDVHASSRRLLQES